MKSIKADTLLRKVLIFIPLSILIFIIIIIAYLAFEGIYWFLSHGYNIYTAYSRLIGEIFAEYNNKTQLARMIFLSVVGVISLAISFIITKKSIGKVD